MIESYYRRSKRLFGNQVIEAKSNGDGELTLGYAQAEFPLNSMKDNTVDVTFKINAGFVDGNPYNINFDNVKAVSGKTIEVRWVLKEKGFKWNPDKKRWEK